MGSVSLENPQMLNLYAYCINDPVNQIDPNGLGFFSFFGNLFKAIGKVFKIIAIVLVVVVVTALVIAYAAPAGSAWLSFAKFLLFKVAPLLAKLVGAGSGSQLGVTILGPGGTPPWNPNGGGLPGIGGFGWDDPIDVITTTTNACKNGNRYPDCGHWYSKLARAVAGGIAVAIALGHVAYQNLAAQEQRFGGWFLRRMDEGSPKAQIGTYPNGDPIYMGLAVGGLSRSSGARAAFLKGLGESGKAPSWMNQYLEVGRVPPGYNVEHITPLSVGGLDTASNMRLNLISNHKLIHKYYHPWRK